MSSETRVWSGSIQRLDRVLFEIGLARSRSQAAEFIAAGKVRVSDAVVTKAGMRIATGVHVSLSGADHYVSRAAHKLIAGLDEFHVDPRGLLALDLGASTGGFTQVLLERGARKVLALDVGHGQLVPELREHPAVAVVEGCNARELTAESLIQLTGEADKPALIVADVSFISLTLVLPAIAAVAADGAQMVLLIKPQFEVGRGGIRDGIVVDPKLTDAAIQRVIESAREHHIEHRGLVPSPLTGEHGNLEFLAYFERMIRD